MIYWLDLVLDQGFKTTSVDVLINSGGVIGLTKDFLNRDDAQTEQALRDIAVRVKSLMIESQQKSISIYDALLTKNL